jgi:hypothetical protein
MRLVRPVLVCSIVLTACLATAWAGPLNRAFTYQGSLRDTGVPATAKYDFEFRLFDAAVGGAQKGATILYGDLQVTNGLFMVDLNFGETVFDATERWLQIGVRPFTSVGAYTLLPRQRLAPAPFATALMMPFSASIDAATDLVTLENTGDGRAMRLLTDGPNGWHTLRIDNYTSAAAGIGIYSTEGPGLYVSAARGAGGEFRVTDPNTAYNAVYARTAGTGAAVHADGRVQVGSTSTAGEVAVFSPAVTGAAVQLVTGSTGGFVQVRDEGGHDVASIEPDVSTGGGGFFRVARSETANAGVYIDGNYAGLLEPRLVIAGTARSATFTMSNTGDASVSLPTDAIGSAEIEDEPGTAANNGLGPIVSTTGYHTIMSRTITVPVAGYVLALATSEIELSHTTGSSTGATFGLTEDPNSLPSDQDFEFAWPAVAPTGVFQIPVSAHGLFAATAGSHTFYFVMDKLTSSGSYTVQDTQLTLVFLPTAYGTVTPSLAQPLTLAGLDDESLDRPEWSPAEAAAEQAESVAFNQARVERELADMKARIAELERTLAEQRTDQTYRPTPPSPEPQQEGAR